MPRRRRSPPEKKRLSLARDNLMTSGESQHALRKHWRKKKRNAERVRRTGERVALAVQPDDFAPVRRPRVRKWGYARLGEEIAAKRERRADLQVNPRKAAAARKRRRLRRGKRRAVKPA